MLAIKQQFIQFCEPMTCRSFFDLWFLEGWRNLQRLYISFYKTFFGVIKSHLKEPFCRRKHQCDINLKRGNEIANTMHCPPQCDVPIEKDPFLIYVCMLQWAKFSLLFFAGNYYF
jgi:hypothetical protein